MAVDKIAIDFDSAQTNIYMLGGGIVLSEPTVAAVSVDEKSQVKAIGDDAKRLIGKTAKNTKIVFPVFEGEIVNEKVAVGVLKGFLKKTGMKGSFVGAHAIFSVPCGVTAKMIEKYKIVAKNCGINKVYFAEAPILSALGQRIPLNDSSPCFVIDMAGGTTNIAAVSLDGIIAGVSVNFGGNKISTDIIDYIAENYNLQIGLLTAEKLKNEIGSLDSCDSLATVVNGRDLRTGAPKSISLVARDILTPVQKYFDKVSELALAVLKKLPPEVSAEIRHSGVYFSGEGSMVYGLENYFASKFEMPITIAENPDMVTALGGGVALGSPDLLNKIKIKFN
jgi:rod shape-determining protein MreB